MQPLAPALFNYTALHTCLHCTALHTMHLGGAIQSCKLSTWADLLEWTSCVHGRLSGQQLHYFCAYFHALPAACTHTQAAGMQAGLLPFMVGLDMAWIW